MSTSSKQCGRVETYEELLKIAQDYYKKKFRANVSEDITSYFILTAIRKSWLPISPALLKRKLRTSAIDYFRLRKHATTIFYRRKGKATVTMLLGDAVSFIGQTNMEDETLAVLKSFVDTEREKEILELRVEGLSYRQIGNKLGFSQTTAKDTFDRICVKLKTKKDEILEILNVTGRNTSRQSTSTLPKSFDDLSIDISKNYPQ